MIKRLAIPKTLVIPMAIAFLIGLAFIFRSPLPIPPQFESYDALGWNLSQGEGFSFNTGVLREPFIFRTPGYPLLLAGFYRLFGHHPWIIYLVQVLLHTFTLVWVYSLSRRFLGERTAAVSTFLVALYPLTAIYIPTILPEVLSTFLVAFSLWLYWKSASSGSSWLMLLTGLVMGYSTLVRPVFALFPLVCIGGSTGPVENSGGLSSSSMWDSSSSCLPGSYGTIALLVKSSL